MLKNRRKKLGISQRKLAKRLNVDRSYLSKVENSKFNNVSVEFIRKISKELKLNPSISKIMDKHIFDRIIFLDKNIKGKVGKVYALDKINEEYVII